MEKPSSLRAYFSTSDNMWLAHSKFDPQIRRLNCGFNDRGSISSKTSCSNNRNSWLGKEWGIVPVDRLATPSHENVHSMSFQALLLERHLKWMTESQSALTCPRAKFCHRFLSAVWDFNLVNHDVTPDRWMNSEKWLSSFFIQTLDEKRGRLLLTLNNTQNCSEIQPNIC